MTTPTGTTGTLRGGLTAPTVPDDARTIVTRGLNSVARVSAERQIELGNAMLDRMSAAAAAGRYHGGDAGPAPGTKRVLHDADGVLPDLWIELLVAPEESGLDVGLLPAMAARMLDPASRAGPIDDPRRACLAVTLEAITAGDLTVAEKWWTGLVHMPTPWSPAMVEDWDVGGSVPKPCPSHADGLPMRCLIIIPEKADPTPYTTKGQWHLVPMRVGHTADQLPDPMEWLRILRDEAR